MTVRTTSAAVIAILGDDYGRKTDGTLPDLAPYIETASAVVDDVVTTAYSNRGITIPSARQELIERWLAAYNYTRSDPIYTSKSTGGASGSFMREQDNPYKDAAINLDISGSLAAILKRQFASGYHIGNPPDDLSGVQDDWL